MAATRLCLPPPLGVKDWLKSQSCRDILLKDVCHEISEFRLYYYQSIPLGPPIHRSRYVHMWFDFVNFQHFYFAKICGYYYVIEGTLFQRIQPTVTTYHMDFLYRSFVNFCEIAKLFAFFHSWLRFPDSAESKLSAVRDNTEITYIFSLWLVIIIVKNNILLTITIL